MSVCYEQQEDFTIHFEELKKNKTTQFDLMESLLTFINVL